MRHFVIVAAGAISALGMIPPAMASTAAAPAVSLRSRPAVPRTFTCSPGYWCVTYEGVENESKNTVSNWDSLGGGGWRNTDDGIWNDMNPGWYLRLYYSTGFGGAHVCIDPGVKIANLSGYVFNNNKGDTGYGQPVKNDVASDTVNQTPCTNSIGS